MCNDNPTQPITSYGKSYIICQYLYLKAILQSYHHNIIMNSEVITVSPRNYATNTLLNL